MMLWIIVFIFAFSMLVFFPLVPGIREWQLKTDAIPLNVRNEYDTDIAYFAHGFRQFIEKNFSAIFASGEFSQGRVSGHRDYYQFTGNSETPVFNKSEIRRKTTRRLVVSAHDLELPDDLFFEKEVYSGGNMSVGVGNFFRALLADGDITLADHNQVLRWIHAEGSITAEELCEFYGRISAKKTITLAPNCYFERIGASEIRFGGPATGAKIIADDEISNVPFTDFARVVDSDAGRYLVDSNTVTPPNWRFAGNIVVKGAFTIAGGANIRGSIKSHRILEIGENSNIEGSIVSSHIIRIGKNCSIKGPVIADKAVFIDSGSIIGLPGLPTSITAANVFIADNVLVHGTIWATDSGLFLEDLEAI